MPCSGARLTINGNGELHVSLESTYHGAAYAQIITEKNATGVGSYVHLVLRRPSVLGSRSVRSVLLALHNDPVTYGIINDHNDDTTRARPVRPSSVQDRVESEDIGVV